MMSRTLTTPQRSTVTREDIPSIERVCELLGFGNAPDKKTEELVEATSEYIQSYDFLDGMNLEQLLDWDKPTVYMELREISKSFLSDPGDRYGERFWGSQNTRHSHCLEYPKDENRYGS